MSTTYQRHVANLRKVLRRRTDLSMVELDCGHTITLVKDIPPVGELMWCFRCAKGKALNMDDFDIIVARNARFVQDLLDARQD